MCVCVTGLNKHGVHPISCVCQALLHVYMTRAMCVCASQGSISAVYTRLVASVKHCCMLHVYMTHAMCVCASQGSISAVYTRLVASVKHCCMLHVYMTRAMCVYIIGLNKRGVHPQPSLYDTCYVCVCVTGLNKRSVHPIKGQAHKAGSVRNRS